MKRICIMTLVLVFILLIGVGGCNMSQEKHDAENQIINEMQDYFRKKYGNVDYEIEGFISSGWGQSYDLLNLSLLINGRKEPFCIERYEDGDKYNYRDNYYGLLVRDDFERYVKDTTQAFFDECIVFAELQGNSFPNTLNAQSSIEDFLKEKDHLGCITFFVVVKMTFESNEDFINAAESYVLEWSRKGIYSNPRIFLVENDVYEEITRDDYIGLLINKSVLEYTKVIK